MVVICTNRSVAMAGSCHGPFSTGPQQPTAFGSVFIIGADAKDLLEYESVQGGMVEAQYFQGTTKH